MKIEIVLSEEDRRKIEAEASEIFNNCPDSNATLIKYRGVFIIVFREGV